MKKSYFVPFAALLALSSCTNEIGEEGFVDKANAISFNAYSYKSRAYTSGDIGSAVELRAGNFGVVGYFKNNIYLGHTNEAVEQTWQESAWGYADPSDLHFWPQGTMDFYAYFPFSANGDVFASSNSGDGTTVMTINNTTGNQDVLFAYTGNQSYINRVNLDFKHAFAKIQGVKIQLAIKNIEIEVNSIEFVNTCTGGKILVDNKGKAKYEQPTSPVTCKYKLASAATITRENTAAVSVETFISLFDKDANKYLFATNSTESQNVTGTGTALWDGKKDTWAANSNLVCIKLNCKVKKTDSAKNTETYLVGAADSYADMYIPMAGTYGVGSGGEDVSALLAGKRYTYKIVMKDNVGFDNNGDPILNPILFKVDNVASWHDVEVTITL